MLRVHSGTQAQEEHLGGIMSAGDVQTFHADGKWWNRVEGQADDPQGPYDTRAAAVEDGRDTARSLKVEHITQHGRTDSRAQQLRSRPPRHPGLIGPSARLLVVRDAWSGRALTAGG